MRFLISYFRKAGLRRILVSTAGNLCIAAGVGIFKLSLLGNDPYSGMNMALGALAGISYANFQILLNLALLGVQLAVGRETVGYGTVFNAVTVGYVGTWVYQLGYRLLGEPGSLAAQLAVMLLGVAVTGLGVSLYQQARLGVSPYDAAALIFHKFARRIPYFWCRILTDATCTLVCFLSGGLVGLGTLVTALGLGPVITFFNRFVSDPILRAGKK
ncbi:MAG: hypothetical protein LUH51_04575 [Firmicutes bacterium]|nr:hypothetical protein [Bacillota bacterium]